MTHDRFPRRPRARFERRHAPLLAAALLLAIGLFAPPAARAEDQPDDPNDPWVAKVHDLKLPRSRLAVVVAERNRMRLQEAGSGPTTVLRQMIEERAVRQEAKRLGIEVLDEEVQAKLDELDTEVKQKTLGRKNLAQVVREQRTSMGELRANLKNQLLKERIAAHPENLGDTIPKDDNLRIIQTEVVITKLLKKTDVKYHWKVATQLEGSETDLPQNVVAAVNGQEITVRQYGEELLLRLPVSDIRQVLVEECKAALTREVALTVEEMTEVIAQEKKNWLAWRDKASQEAFRHVDYEEYVKLRYHLDLEQMRTDRYFRGLFGLIRQERQKITPEQVRKQWEDNREGRYGDAIRVYDVEILFAPQNPLLGQRTGRDRKEALRLANDYLRRIGTGVTFDQLAREVNARVNKDGKPDPSIRARRLLVRNTASGRLLFEKAKDMKDGQVSRPFETLSEVHVIRRESFEPAPTFEDLEDGILESMAQQNANTWLDEQVSDPKVVQVRWPLPETGP